MVNRKKAALSLALMAAVALTGSLSVYASEANAQGNTPVITAVAQIPEASPSLHVDNAKWNYDETNDIYYQIGLVYCAKPQATEYESLAVYVPGAYMQGVKNPDGTYTCQINPKAKVGNYTAATAPVVMPVNTGGYAAQKAPSSYDGTGLSTYLSQGFVYVYAGCRGRSNGTNPDGTAYDGGAPWGVTDLKAAVRYLRYNDSLIPGNKNRIFTFGHSGGGAQSALMGATGDSEMYMPYLSSIGALMKDRQGKPLSDAVDGAMCWCPITNLTQADLSYEWMMGQFSSEGTRAYGTWTRSLSRDMARAYADSLNRMGLRDEQGNVLTLTQSESGIYMAGPYYDYLKTTIETSLNNFLKDNQFPLTTGQNDFHVDGAFPGQGVQTGAPVGMLPGGPTGLVGGGKDEVHTYNSAKEYIDALNGDNPWITYDEKTNTATIPSVEAFVEHMKQATKSVGAFDDMQKAQAENLLFGNGQNDALHFDGNMTYFMEKRQNTYKNYRDYDDSIRQAYEGDMNNVDALHVDTLTRQLMYDPMTFILVPAGEKKPSTLAKHWRIHTGISQGDTALTTEVNLALALKQRKDVEDVDFATVWEKKHTMAERTGSSTENFIQWVKDSVASEK
ncbi:subtype A tannase [Allisonella histaminiformans]|uniref:subtype A tannase n=1 Tax=Allisonella histaminiformans TaxID=209880 RepID=UPI0026E9D449|nr:subtype A tannase [Allisonella histaminiformans]